jgi:dihydroorotate dehydrogenase electron transfer subunit
VPLLGKYPIVGNQKISNDIYRLVFSAPAIARTVRPGQFVQIRLHELADPLLRRPFSVSSVGVATGTVEVLYRVVGKGTRLLSTMPQKSLLDVLGPLGNTFTINRKHDLHVLVAGGMGMAPLVFLAKTLVRRRENVVVLLGQKKRDQKWEWACLADLRGSRTCAVKIASEKREKGAFPGMVTDLLTQVIAERGQSSARIGLYACGPRPMLHKLQQQAAILPLPCQVSLEESMACGLGTCLGCVVQVGATYKKVCTDGPVFNVRDIDFSTKG